MEKSWPASSNPRSRREQEGGNRILRTGSREQGFRFRRRGFQWQCSDATATQSWFGAEGFCSQTDDFVRERSLQHEAAPPARGDGNEG